MKQFVFKACWSQTDQECFIVEAETREAALQKCKNSQNNPHHWDFVCTLNKSVIK